MSAKAEGGMQNAEWAKHFAPATVTVRYKSHTFHARCNGKTASCTSQAKWAVLRAAKKWFACVAASQECRAPEEREIEVVSHPGVWTATVKGAKA